MSVDSQAGSGSIYTNLIASIVAVVFLATSVWLIYSLNDWQQVTVIYNSLCAVAFSAFGVLLGSKVQEVNVTKAVQKADQAVSDLQKKSVAIKAATKALQGDTPDNEAGGGVMSELSTNRAALAILTEALN